METHSVSPKQERSRLLLSNMLKSKYYEKIRGDVVHVGQLTKKIAKEDPRRVIHSLKVGLALTLVSLFYYFDPLYQGFGVNAMWAVLTVLVVFEFSLGATLGKGVNRGMATILGGIFGVGAHRLSSVWGEKFEPVFLGFSVFITAGVITFMRFYPKMKARYDYGLLIFMLTFSLISVSGYRDEEVIDMAHRRISTILIGSSIAVIVCFLICPFWAGSDLHNLLAHYLLTLSLFLQGFGDEYFKMSLDTTPNDDNEASLDSLKNIINSKNNIDALVQFAKWEPRHGRLKREHPWNEYQKIGELAQQCASRAQTLHSFLHKKLQATKEVKEKFEEACLKMSVESGKALNELSLAMTKMTQPSKAKPHIKNAKEAAQNLNVLLSSKIWNNLNISQVTSVATIGNLLADVVDCVDEIYVAVEELASMAKFKKINKDGKVGAEIERTKLANQGSIKRRSFANHVIVIDGSSPASSPKKSVLNKDPLSLAMAQQTTE